MGENIKPYGDTLNDGIVQLSFTLPVAYDGRAKKAAELYVAGLNFEQISVVHAEAIGEKATYFVVYGRAIPFLDYSGVTSGEIETEKMGFYEINDLIKSTLGRKMVVVGATIGSDAHTVGIDAIMNMKGYKQDYGLERYPEIAAYNMGAQVTCEDLIKKALDVNADAILVSQTVSQKDAHISNFTELVELLEAERLRNRFILVAGGARVNNAFSIELGYDGGFGPGTLPSHVASWLILKLLKMKGVTID